MNRKLTAVLATSLLAAACGYSEDEWQAQLDKYSQLDSRFKNEQSEHAATRAALADAQARVAALESKLQDMGVNMDELNKALQAEGAEKARISATLDDTQRALAEYKARAAQLERIRERFELLRSKLEKLTTLGLKVSIRNNRMVISLPGDVLFASGQDKLRNEGIEVLDQVAQVIRADSALNARFFQVAGHTDNVALKGGQFRDNWGLSAMRARQVLVYLVSPTDAKGGGGGLKPTHLHAAGYGETDPMGPNDTPEQRQANRRVELVLMPDVEEMLDLKQLI
ncbi:MAG: OmpA family protein [Polyangiaceae bacterium]|nr:OmpA family protein [Polyangiaceae bacterium]MCW5789491.1 OmpA family protein [Polyangiaceae bacterium]